MPTPALQDSAERASAQPDKGLHGAVFVSSRYNFLVPFKGGVLLYNCNTGAVLRLAGGDAEELASALCRGVFEIHPDDFPDDLAQQLAHGGFLVPSGTDELAAIRERFWKARGSTPLVVTLTTTMNCNLGCYYCYESRSGERLHASDVSAIVAWVEQGLKSAPAEGLHVDWYGGDGGVSLAGQISNHACCRQRLRCRKNSLRRITFPSA